MKEKELQRISAMWPAADAGNKNGVMWSSLAPLPFLRGVALARRSSCTATHSMMLLTGHDVIALVQFKLAGTHGQNGDKAMAWGRAIQHLLKDRLAPRCVHNGSHKSQRDAQWSFVIPPIDCQPGQLLPVDRQQGQQSGTSPTCRIRASKSDDSACSMVLYDLLASAFCRTRICSTLLSDPKAISAAQHSDAQCIARRPCSGRHEPLGRAASGQSRDKPQHRQGPDHEQNAVYEGLTDAHEPSNQELNS